MEKDFINVRYLKFSAEDPWETKFQDVIIDLVTDRLISGIICSGCENEDKWSIDINKDLANLPNPEYSIFAKVVDTGVYELLDEDLNPIFRSEGYVPSLMDFYNCEEGFGDCIELFVDDLRTGHLTHNGTNKIKFNHAEDWEEIEQHPNLYEKGMNDAFNIILKILTSDDKFKITNAINVINNFKNKAEA